MKNIWFLDDDASSHKLFQIRYNSLQANYGYSLKCFYSIPEAIQALDKGEVPDVLIVDVHLRNDNGIDFLHHVKCERNIQDTDYYILSNSMNPKDMLKAKKLEVADYLVKPIFDDDIEKIIIDNRAKFPQAITK